MKFRWIGLGVLIALIGALFLVRGIKHRPTGPLQISFWYWQTPYTLSKDDQSSLKRIGVTQMFVRAGTFSSDGTNIVLRFPQEFAEGATALPVQLVFNTDAGVLRHFEDYNLATIVPEMSERMATQVKRAQVYGLKVTGVQLDFDIPTRLLPRYSSLVAKIRASNPLFQRRSDFQFSITGLMSWLGTHGLETLSNEVDFMVPQAYEGFTGRTPNAMRPVFDPEELKKRMPAAERLNCPYWIGIPAYGHALLYDNHDHLLGTYRNLEAQDALRHPSFHLVDAYPTDRLGHPAKDTNDWVGEEILKFKAIKPAPSGYGLGYTLAYSIPTPAVLKQSYDLVSQGRGSGCQGVIIYRMPETGSSFSLPISTIEKTLHKEQLTTGFNVKLTSNQDTYEAIETNRKNIPMDIFLETTNVGSDPTFVARNAAEITLTIDKPGFGELRLRDFDSATYARSTPGQTATSADPRFADEVHLKKGFCSPGKKLLVGPIRLLNSGPVRVKISVKVRSSSGFADSQKTLPDVILQTKPGK